MGNIKEEKIFLYLIIAVVAVFLINSPGDITGAAVAGAEESDTAAAYFIIIAILIIILFLATLIFHVLNKKKVEYKHQEGKLKDRNQEEMLKDQKLFLEDSPDEDAPITSLKTKTPLPEKLGRINQEIEGLSAEEIPLPPRLPKKITRMPTIKDKKLEQELEKVDLKIKKPTVIGEPERDEKLSSSLNYVEQELAGLDSGRGFKKVNYRETMPSMTKIVELREKEKLRKELDKLSEKLSERDPDLFPLPERMRRLKEKLRLRKAVREEVEGDVPTNELQDIEEELRKLQKR